MMPMTKGTAMDKEKSKLELTKDEAYSVASHIDATLIQTIRDDVDIDNMMWLRNMIHGYEKLCQYSGYVGLTEYADTEGKDGKV